MDNPRSIIDLPVEVLDLIFTHLIYMNYKVELAKVHEKLTKAFVYHSKNEFRRLKVTPWLSNESFLLVIQECGHTTEELVFDRSCDFWNDILIEAVTKYCTNLKSFTAVLYRSDSDQICSFLRKINKLLLSLSLEQRSRFPFEILKVVGEMTQLKELSVKGYIDENVNEIQKLVALEKLNIEQHYYLDKPDVNILRICSSLSNLRKLTINNVHIISCEEPHSKMWADLETLKLIICALTPELPDCPNLKVLDIHYLRNSNEGYILKFILKNGRNLKTLYERCHPPIDANGFLQLLRGCPNLRYLYTPLEYIKLYAAYLSTIVEILRENKVTPENPFELVVCRRIKWKWFRRLLRRTPNAELISLYLAEE
uniref:Uncharacterized protein, isoform B n=1 Tax=Drosophila melanogaster TaxID=7227 RepID=M9PCW4_DROME|nr:uncharacterized protein Dmel_CG44004, isoform B [Drosophila melanogaster]NP_001287104.1 uncharacterized protein Dmel_CG44004, isoform C [Drosophila melanogaster]AGB94697.2 uncharacterized protein Dmel_CG44004, isoform B [Drosophila melanogaster]AHN58129.1 uncharacterized protein Dmel_CG44004, isoform C [Drosophila melanogaster]|eukprot:NP_001262004.2 uncharacterized protein Dmel_CG44004, isoform B [Drosophila melanogaster]